MKTMENEPGPLVEGLARFLLGYRTTPHTATSCTPAEILMGRRIRTRLDLLHPNLSARMAEKTGNADQSTPRVYEFGEPVMVKDYCARQSKWTKGVVQHRIGPVTDRVQVGNLVWTRHLNQLSSIAGSKVADQVTTDQIDPERVDPLPSLIPQQSRQEPKVSSSDPA